jgi:hypothetical protein
MENGYGNKASAQIPVIMSLAALLLIAVHLAINGMKPDTDEGLLAHLYQLLVLGQLPVIGYFVIQWGRQSPRHASRVVIAQAFALAAAVVPLHFFGL